MKIRGELLEEVAFKIHKFIYFVSTNARIQRDVVRGLSQGIRCKEVYVCTKE